MTTKYINIGIGFFSGLVICNQSIRSLAHINLIPLFFALLFILYFILWLKDINQIKVKVGDFPFIFFGIATLFYALSSVIETGVNNLSLLFDLLVLFFFYSVGRVLNKSSLKVILILVIAIGSAHSLMLVVNRAYVYSAGVNYLLMSLSVGLATCLSYIAIYKTPSRALKIISLLCFLLGWLGLFSMQSRATFIFVALYTFIFPAFLMSHRKRLYYVLGIVLVCFSSGMYFLNEIVYFYENSKVYQRMSDLIFNFSNEPRFITYGTYFSKIDEFYLTGYGIGGTTPNIYSHTIEKYPHNIILEFWSEFGLIGLLFSLSFLFKGLLDCIRYANKSFYSGVITTIFLFYLMNFMKSFSIYDSSVFFLALGMVTNKALQIQINDENFYLGVRT